MDADYVDDGDISPKTTPTPKPRPQWPHLHLNKQIKESATLVEEVDEILSKPASSPSTPKPEP